MNGRTRMTGRRKREERGEPQMESVQLGILENGSGRRGEGRDDAGRGGVGGEGEGGVKGEGGGDSIYDMYVVS